MHMQPANNHIMLVKAAGLLQISAVFNFGCDTSQQFATLAVTFHNTAIAAAATQTGTSSGHLANSRMQ
jgi:hypothetical protein